MRIKVETDLSAFADLFDVTDEEVNNKLVAAVNTAAFEYQTRVVESTPVITANLRNSISVEMATADDPTAIVYSNVEYAQAVEYGTGVYSEAPGALRKPIVIYAKQVRYRTGKGGKKQKTPVKLMTFKNADGRWTSAQAVIIAGMRPRAMFRKNLPYLEAKLDAEITKVIKELGK